MTVREPTRDPLAAAIMARLDTPDHDPEFWERLTEELKAGALEQTTDGGTASAGTSWGRATVTSLHRSRLRSRLALVAVAAVFAVLAGYSLIRVGENRQSIAPAESIPDVSDSGETSYARLGGDDPDWAFSDHIAWVDDRFVALTSFPEQEWHWTSFDGISWQRQDGPSEQVFPPWAECAPGFSCDIELFVEPLPFLNAGTATRPEARAGDRLLVSAWVTYGVFGTDLEGFSESAERLDPELLSLAAESDRCFGELRDNPDAGTVSGAIVGETGDWKIVLNCREADQPFRASFAVSLNDHMTQAQAERVANPQSHSELWVTGPRGTPKPVEGVDDWIQVASSGDRFWMLTDGDGLVTSVDGLAWDAVLPPDLTDLTDLTVQWFAAGPGGHVAIQFDDHQAAPGRSVVVLSHDDGVTWSEPVEVRTEDRLISVGGAGAALLVGTDDGAQGLLVNDGRAIPLFSQPGDWPYPAVTAGEDRVLVQRIGEDHDGPDAYGSEYYEVFDAEGALIHRASADIPSRWQRIQPFVLVSLATAAMAGAVLVYRRRQVG